MGSGSTYVGAAIEKVSTARGGGSRSEAAAASALRDVDELGTVRGLDLGCTDPKAILAKDLAMIDIDQGLSPVAWPAVAGAG